MDACRLTLHTPSAQSRSCLCYKTICVSSVLSEISKQFKKSMNKISPRRGGDAATEGETERAAQDNGNRLASWIGRPSRRARARGVIGAGYPSTVRPCSPCQRGRQRMRLAGAAEDTQECSQTYAWMCMVGLMVKHMCVRAQPGHAACGTWGKFQKSI
jgi:hypothetical protein